MMFLLSSCTSAHLVTVNVACFLTKKLNSEKNFLLFMSTGTPLCTSRITGNFCLPLARNALAVAISRDGLRPFLFLDVEATKKHIEKQT